MDSKILIVEDEQSVVDMLRKGLEPEGFQVIAAYNGQDGLRAVTEARPDLLILDLTLPGLDGFEICRRIRQQPETARLPILVLSGRTEEVDKVVMLELGADDYVTKPFNTKELVARVKTLLRRVSTPELPRVLRVGDRKSTRLNSSHLVISYAVFCLKKKKRNRTSQLYQLLVFLQ